MSNFVYNRNDFKTVQTENREEEDELYINTNGDLMTGELAVPSIVILAVPVDWITADQIFESSDA